jgi:hypothetical protein
MKTIANCTDTEIWKGVLENAKDEREGLARGLEYLAQVESRDLYLGKGYSDMRDFCTRGLGLCNTTAGKRIWVSRKISRFPLILEFLSTGKLHLTAVCLIAKHLTEENHRSLLEHAAELKTESRIKWWLSELFPAPEDWELVGYEKVTPLAGNRARVEMIVDREYIELVERSREVHEHLFPDGNVVNLIKRALREDLKRNDPILRRERRAKKKPRPAKKHSGPVTEQVSLTRHIPRGISDDSGIASDDHCAFIGDSGVHCIKRGGLQADHCENWAWGGSSKDPRNVQKFCRHHNQWKARRDFKKDFRTRRTGEPLKKNGKFTPISTPDLPSL